MEKDKRFRANEVTRTGGMTGVFLIRLLFMAMTTTPCYANKDVPLDGLWQFVTDPYGKGEIDGWWKGLPRDRTGSEVMVPGNWDVYNEYATYVGTVWYQREFLAEADWEANHVRLVFESVYHDAKVWLNGELIGENELGYLPFSFDISESILFGQSNVIVVMVNNTHRRGAMWNWGGIRRPVWLEVTDKSRLEYQHITATPDLKSGDAEVDISFDVSNYGDITDKLTYDLQISYDHKEIWHQKGKSGLTIAAGERETERLVFRLPRKDVHLWHFNDPHLYTSVVRIYRAGILIHELGDRFGIRKVEVEGETIKLNGEPIRTVGFNIVPEDRTSGSSLPLWRIMEDVDLMKSLGANMARLSHQPLPKAYLDYLDQKGFLVFEEVGLWGKDIWVDPNHPLPKEWLSRMIKQKYNHPSVIGWSVGNEIGYEGNNPLILPYVEGAIRQAKEQDPSRLAVYVTHSAQDQPNDATQFSDVVMLNRYEAWGESAERAHGYQPGKPMFYSEYGQGITTEDPNNAVIHVKRMLDEMRWKPYLMGASYWTLNDYRSSYSGTPPSGNRTWGVVNSFRQPKRAYWQFRKEYAPVRSFELKGNTSVEITPRMFNDLPAYVLRGYRLVWEAYGDGGVLLDGGVMVLPDISPGDEAMEKEWTWNHSLNKAAKISVSLLDPQGYAVCDTVAHLKQPSKPEIIGVHAQSGTIRIQFKKHIMATSWKVKYRIVGDTTYETAETINDFVDITPVKPKTNYEVQLVAVNSCGESEPTENLMVGPGVGELPPIIWHTEPVDSGFFVGYGVAGNDDRYQVQYGEQSGDYGNFSMVQLSTKGVGFVPGLLNGKTYYYRIRRLLEWGYPSDWSNEIQVVAGLEEPKLKPIGVIRDGGDALLIFELGGKAVGCRIRYTAIETGEANTVYLSAARLRHAILKGLSPNKNYRFEMAPVSEKMEGGYVGFDD